MGGWVGAGRGRMAAAGAGAWWRGGWGGSSGSVEGGGGGGRAVSSVTSVGISIMKRHASRRVSSAEYLMRIRSMSASISMLRSTLGSPPPLSLIRRSRQSVNPVEKKRKSGNNL